MEETTKEFIQKIKINTYIYTFTFMAVGVLHAVKQTASVAPLMLLLAAFAFYAVGRQVNMLIDIEGGTKADNQPKAPAWVRGVTYFVVLLMFLSVFVT